MIIELVSRMNSQRGRWVCWKSKKNCFLESGLMRNTYTRYHICLMRVFIILLSTSHNVYTCHSPKYYHGTTLLLLLCTWYTVSQMWVCRGSVIIELISRMNSQRECWVCWKSKKTYFLGGGLMRNTYTRYHICLMRVKSRRVSLKKS